MKRLRAAVLHKLISALTQLNVSCPVKNPSFRTGPGSTASRPAPVRTSWKDCKAKPANPTLTFWIFPGGMPKEKLAFSEYRSGTDFGVVIYPGRLPQLRDSEYLWFDR